MYAPSSPLCQHQTEYSFVIISLLDTVNCEPGIQMMSLCFQRKEVMQIFSNQGNVFLLTIYYSLTLKEESTQELCPVRH